MFEEDYPPPGYKKPTESFLFWYLALSLIFASWTFGGTVSWSPHYLIALGILAPALMQIQKSLGLFEQRHGLLKFFFALSPFWFMLAVQLGGLWASPLHTVFIGDREYLALGERNPWAPLNTVPAASWTPTLLAGALYAMGLCIPFIAESHYLFKKLLITLTANALLLSLLGFVVFFSGFETILGIYTPPTDAFFGVFAHAEHWASFALLWLIVMTGLIDHFGRRLRMGQFFERGGIILLVAMAALAYSIVITGSSLHILLLALFFSFVFIQRGSTRESAMVRGMKGRLTALAWVGAGLIIFAGGVFFSVRGYIAPAAEDGASGPARAFSTNIPAATQFAIWRDSWALFEKQPLFGWGAGSYSTVMAFNQESDLGDALYATPHSDLLHSLVERGVLGTLAWGLPLVVVAWRFRTVKFKRVFSSYLWSAAGIALILGAVAFPFRSPAFTLSFWIILFSAYQWSRVAMAGSNISGKPNIVFGEREFSGARKARAHREQALKTEQD